MTVAGLVVKALAAAWGVMLLLGIVGVHASYLSSLAVVALLVFLQVLPKVRL